jgi:hypothetical protein
VATDALAILKVAVNLSTCALCICDATGDGKVSTADALRVLQIAVSSSGNLACLVCRNQATIGENGGTLTSKDGAISIVFPPGAIHQQTQVSIEGAPKSELGAALFADEGAKAYRLQPDSLQLFQDLKVVVHRDASLLSGAGTFGVPLLLFLSRHDGILEGLADQRADLQVGEGDATATLAHFSTLGVIPLDVTAKVTGVPAVIDAQQIRPITASVTVGAGEKVVEVADARYVDDDFGAWQPADGFALDDPLEETFGGTLGDSYDYICTQQISVGYSPRIVTTLNVVADVDDPPVGIETTMAFQATIQCNAEP